MKQLISSVLLAGLPIAILVFKAHHDRRQRRARYKTPFTDKLLRPPGESLREELLRLDERLNDELVLFFFISIGIGGIAWTLLSQQTSTPWIVLLFALIPAYGFCLRSGRKLFKLKSQILHYDLGFLGERAVGEELNQMLAKGYKVYHDIPFETRPGSKTSHFNIDHVAVGPGGIFAVETKMRSKPITQAPQKNNPLSSPSAPLNTPKTAGPARNTVVYDGQTLIFPWGKEDTGLKQARANAYDLRTWLQKALAIDLEVTPVLALPGWFVERKGKGDVRVVSGREICSVFPNAKTLPFLTPTQIKQIAFQLEQRCRNVEVG